MVAGTRTRLQMVLEIQVQIDVFPVKRAGNAIPVPVFCNGRPSGALLFAAVQLKLRTCQSGIHPHARGQLAAAPLLQQPFHHGAANSLQKPTKTEQIKNTAMTIKILLSLNILLLFFTDSIVERFAFLNNVEPTNNDHD